MPWSKRELARCFPDLRGTYRAVENDLLAASLSGQEPQIEYLFGKPGHLILHRATYRRCGQRGSASPALIRADVADPRAALEAVVGPLASFELVAQPQPAERAAPEPSAPEPSPYPPPTPEQIARAEERWHRGNVHFELTADREERSRAMLVESGMSEDEAFIEAVRHQRRLFREWMAPCDVAAE